MARKISVGLLIFCSLLSIYCQADLSKTTALHEFEGVWQGIGKQDDGSVWSISITLSPESYLIAYPSLACGGTLELFKANENSLIFREVLKYGLENCINEGKTVLIKSTDNMLRYYWYYGIKGKKGAAGKLTRQFFLKKSSLVPDKQMMQKSITR
jgi:hypothetical protein